jgi:hypothetical protein
MLNWCLKRAIYVYAFFFCVIVCVYVYICMYIWSFLCTCVYDAFITCERACMHILVFFVFIFFKRVSPYFSSISGALFQHVCENESLSDVCLRSYTCLLVLFGINEFMHVLALLYAFVKIHARDSVCLRIHTHVYHSCIYTSILYVRAVVYSHILHYLCTHMHAYTHCTNMLLCIHVYIHI